MAASTAMAECARPNGAGTSVFDFVPLASGTAVTSIISTISAINTSSLAQSTALVSVPPNPSADQQGGGHWSRVIAGTVENENNTTTSGSAVVPNVGFASGTVDCRATTKLDFIGTQAGMDVGRYNFAGGGNIHWGFTAGYFDVSAKDKTPNVGTFSSENQVPFAGIYFAISSGALSFDAQLRGDYYHMELSDVDQGLFDQPLTARGVAFLWNAAYRIDLPNRWFIEPSIGGVSSRTEVDQLEVAGGFYLPNSVTPSLTLPGVVKIDDINSLLGRASVRVGTTFQTQYVAWQPFATGSVFHEFAGNVRTDIATGPTPGIVPPNLSATSFTSREGTYGHIGIGLAGVLIDTGWLGYIRGDYRFGDNVEGISVNAGLRYQFSPMKEASAGMKDGGSAYGKNAFNWTGLYAGWFTGGIIGEGDWVDNQGATEPRLSGYVAGGTLGYNFQMGHVVFGIEGDLGWANAKGGRDCPGAGNDAFFFTCEAEIGSLGTLTGRIGVTRERALFYAKGGLAIGEVEARVRGNLGGLDPRPPFNFNQQGGQSDSETLTGWVIGGGVEYALTDRWTAKAEYLHFDLGKNVFETFTTSPANIGTTGDTVRIGVNYHFGHRGGDHHHDSMK